MSASGLIGGASAAAWQTGSLEVNIRVSDSQRRNHAAELLIRYECSIEGALTENTYTSSK